MSEQLPEPPDDGHPILAGVGALVGVTLAVGLILGGVAVAGAKVVGIGDDGDSSGATSERSLYVPRPERTPKETSPQITLAPGDSTASSSPTQRPTRSESPRTQITLSAGSTSVGSMDRLDLTGVYAGGEGAILRVERYAGGSWQDFGVTFSVSDEMFQTYVQTGVLGVNKFRVVDTDSGLESNEVRVTVG
ncbi:hypothetical protein [Nocardioides sp. SR21]|uniref:hypothetical protein n=1 Tax=Nocardioides sp. SR21 TaxID=2919501 RepID=UPI001FA985E0|nr:hypothetical protein [Nocardioides sp. SR21]